MKTHRNPKRLALVVVLSLATTHAALATDELLGSDPWDCATISLYQILRLEGRPVKLGRLRSDLGRAPAGGYSMHDIRDVARRHGVTLDARLLPKSASALDRPMLLFVRQEGEGHFAVVRPVGHTGRLLQWLDRGHPDVSDKQILLDSTAWTGLALVPRANGLSTVLKVAACTLLMGGTGAFAFRRVCRHAGDIVQRLRGATKRRDKQPSDAARTERDLPPR